MAWTNKTGVNLGVGKPATTGLWNKTWDNLVYLYDLLLSHQHNGADGTALIEVGPNLLRNGSFESGTTSAWTPTTNTGGTVVVQTGNAMHGKYCLAITSTVLANGGGSALSDEYMPVAPGVAYTALMSVKGSVANISSKIEIVWYNSAQAQISASSVQDAATLTTAHRSFVSAVAPANAAYARVRVYGGVPAVGSAVGTIYIDGCKFGGISDHGELLSYANVTSSVAAVDFATSVDWTAYDEYVIHFHDVKRNTASATLGARISTDGGATFLSTANYVNTPWNGAGSSVSVITLDVNIAQDTNAITDGYLIVRPTAQNIGGTRQGFVQKTNGGYGNGDASGAWGWSGTALTLGGVRFLMSSGNITAGKFAVFGRKLS